MRARLVVAGLLVVCSAASLLGQRGGGAGRAESVSWQRAGRSQKVRIFTIRQCSTCHGAGGGGGEIGPAIVSGDRVDIGAFRCADVQHHQERSAGVRQ